MNRRSDRQTALVSALSLLLVFAIPISLQMNQRFGLIALLLLLPLAAIALRHRLRGAVLAVMLLDGGLTLIIALSNQRDMAAQYQLVMIAIALVGLWLGGVAQSHHRVMQRQQDFAKISNDLLWETDSQGRLLSISGRLAQELALSSGQSWNALFSGLSREHLATLKHVLARQQPFHRLEVAIQDNTGLPRWLQIDGLALWSEAGELIGYRGTVTDITRSQQARTVLNNYNQNLQAEVAQRTLDLRQSNSELIVKEQRLQLMLAAAPVGLLEFDDGDRCRYLNANASTLTGFSLEQAQGRHILDFVRPQDRPQVEQAWNSHRLSRDVQWLEFHLNHNNVWCAAYWIGLRQTDRSSHRVIMALADSTVRRMQEERLWTLAHHDALTDLPNRNLFADRCAQALSLARRHDSGAALLWIDLDAFKAVNDTLGHTAGDLLLQQVAQRLTSRVRDSDTVARMGGDEFAVIMPEVTDPEMALKVANELIACMGAPFELSLGTIHISSSIGVALYPQHADSVETLTQRADLAMYSAKQAGKNQVWVCEGGRPNCVGRAAGIAA